MYFYYLNAIFMSRDYFRCRINALCQDDLNEELLLPQQCRTRQSGFTIMISNAALNWAFINSDNSRDTWIFIILVCRNYRSLDKR